MGVTKKPAVIAKTAHKKRGRPAGSKNKSKLVEMDAQLQKEAAKYLASISTVDWETLAKRLQEALAAEMKLNEKYERAGFFKRLAFAFTGNI
jgi:hypothetical protein